VDSRVQGSESYRFVVYETHRRRLDIPTKLLKGVTSPERLGGRGIGSIVAATAFLSKLSRFHQEFGQQQPLGELLEQ
jgi:hypothetical protein